MDMLLMLLPGSKWHRGPFNPTFWVFGCFFPFNSLEAKISGKICQCGKGKEGTECRFNASKSHVVFRCAGTDQSVHLSPAEPDSRDSALGLGAPEYTNDVCILAACGGAWA